MDNNARQTVLARLRQRMAQTEDSEPEQALIRLVIALLLALYYCFPWAQDVSFVGAVTSFSGIMAIIFFVAALAIVSAVVLYPVSSPARRVAGIVLDLVMLSVMMHVLGQEAMYLFAIYLWVILGNGFRYGINYLYLSQLIGVVGFYAAVTWGDYWKTEATQPIAVSLLFLLALIPAYSAFLIKKLHTAIDDAKQANEAKTKFLANMSHELRTPLNGVIGLGDLLRETKLDQEQQDLVQTMHQSAYTLLGLIEKVLDISKIEAGKLEISFAQLDLHALINSVISIQSTIGAAKGLTVSCNMDSNVPFLLEGDEQHLKQVLINLIGNAIKFTDEGSVTLHVKRVLSEGETALIRFEVKDTGIGIAEELLTKVFDDFTQVSGSAQSTVGGTGLGTTISKDLVELMGGQIGVESRLGEGSVFWFELPFSEIVQDTLDIADNHVLLVLSDSSAQRVQPLLTGWNVAFDLAESPVHALSLLATAEEQSNPYEVVVLDKHALKHTTPIAFAQTLQVQSLDDLSLILVNDDPLADYHAELDSYYISTIANLDDKRLLFNAIHAAQSIHVNSHNVVSIADYYHNQSGAKQLNILVAEDNRVNQQVIEGILTRVGHKVSLADDGEQALDMLTQNLEQIDLLIVDKNMPGRSGDEVVQALRFLDTKRALPVIMLTADATPEARESSMEIGVDLFLTKPLDSRDLLEKIAVLSKDNEDASSNQSSITAASVEMKVQPTSNVVSHTAIEHQTEQTTNPWFDEGVFGQLVILGNDTTFIKRLINGFTADGEKHIALIHESVLSDYLQLRESLHALKGSATELGAMKLADLCKDGEKAKPYDIGTDELLKLSKDIEFTYQETVSAFEQAVSSVELESSNL